MKFVVWLASICGYRNPEGDGGVENVGTPSRVGVSVNGQRTWRAGSEHRCVVCAAPRTLLRGLGGSAALGALGALAGCGVPAAYVAPGDRAATDRSAGERRLTWANWPLYIDTDDDHPGRRPTLEAFEQETGISVDYIEEINDNDEFFGKISPSLMNHQPTDRDLIVISDWMCGRFVRLGWVQEMDRSTSRT
ncbi:hypothetical protein SVIOM342S_05100 [Streptomyces violaceorubidus]